ncbi:MAG TPA: type II CRISPR RNA-guided endonuclease Cas9 [Rhodanobacteraceae bacterium]|nr:type II CRISPR RNA-guided endonuclease Cas9 [Rhodanobacteraceae bacterium]
MARIKYRLALDMGANSLGWCVYRLDGNDEPDTIVRMGSRIFSDGRDPKTLASRAADRRAARQARRRRDRVLKRRHKLMQALVKFGLMPADETKRKQLQAFDPYDLRARGLDQPLLPHELGRALYHLARKRGFRSSRKDARSKEAADESGKVKQAIAALRERVHAANCRTVGEYLAREHAARAPVRARRTSDGGYVLYLQRGMVEEEFDKLWAAQQPHQPQLLTDAARDTLRDIMLFQRRLKPVEPGRCPFETGEYRARLCAPIQQRFRMLQELNHLRVNEGIGDRPLTLNERNQMLAVLSAEPGLVTFAKLAKSAGLPNAKAFNYGRDEKRKGLKGDAVAAQFSAADALGHAWHDLEPAQQYALAVLVAQADQMESLESALLALPAESAAETEILRGIFDASERAVISTALRSLPLRPTVAQARNIAGVNLPDDYGSLSLKALSRIVPELERDVVTYDEAVRRAGYASHSQFHSGEIFMRLPYYGEVLQGYTAPMPTAQNADERKFGRIPNPTVHIGLNQVRQLVNALIKRYGPPHQIVIELTREFGASGEKRREITSRQKENQERNERYDEELRALGVHVNRANRQKLQLWEELGKDDAMDRYCIYSGQRLSKTMLFSDEVEVDHILPFSQTLHDGIGNKILCTRQSNRDKGNRTPFIAWGHDPARWAGIEERAARLPEHKRKLFREDALEVFLDGKDFLARHLTDTAYLGRAAKQYLTYVCPQNEVWVSSGKLTGMIRGKYGLSKLLSGDGVKNRNDHRHHALDAAVIGLCSRSLIQRMAHAAEQAEAHGENRLLERLALPWSEYREELAARLAAIVVSHKPDHGRQAALHNDTNYGWRGGPDKRGTPLVGRRRPLESIKSAADAESIASESLRREIVRVLSPLSGAKDIKAALADYSERTGIRRVICEERLSVIPIHDRRNGKPYRYVKGDGNYCYEVFRKPDGRWDGEVISSFEANQRGFNESPTEAQNGMPLIMRICKDDVLAIEREGKTRYMRVAKFSVGMIAMADLREANVDARTRDKNSGLKYFFKSPSALKPLRTRLVGVNILGYVNDPGFKE